MGQNAPERTQTTAVVNRVMINNASHKQRQRSLQRRAQKLVKAVLFTRQTGLTQSLWQNRQVNCVVPKTMAG